MLAILFVLQLARVAEEVQHLNSHAWVGWLDDETLIGTFREGVGTSALADALK